MSLQIFVARVNKSNDQLEQFPPRDDRTPQVKLAGKKLMDILENAMPKSQSQKGRATTTSATGSNQKVLKKKRGQEADLPSLSSSQ
eukprot:4758900-Ditylum_brightwellii.AAC.1